MKKKLRATNSNVWPGYYTWLTVFFLGLFIAAYRLYFFKYADDGFQSTADLWSLIIFMFVFGIEAIVFAYLDHRYFFKHWR